MVIANSPLPEVTPAESVVKRESARFTSFLFWLIAIVLTFVVPLGLVLGAVFVSSWGIPLPIYVAVP